MKQHGGRWRIFLGLASSVLVLAACGGGGGGGGGGGPVVPTSYTGQTSQAMLSVGNAQPVVQGAWYGGSFATDVGGVIPFAAGEAGPATAGVHDLASRLRDLVLQADAGERGVVQPAAVQTTPVTGDCGGSGTLVVDDNPITGAFSGQANFSSYCTLGTTISGSMNFFGQVDPASLLLRSMTMTFNNLSVIDATFSGTIVEGSVAFVVAADGNSETDSLDYVLRDNLLNKSYWINDYRIQILYGALSDQITLTGRYYDPDFGFVDIATLQPLQVSTALVPDSGTMLFTGQGSKAQLRFNPGQSPLLDLDANNDGVYELTISDPL